MDTEGGDRRPRVGAAVPSSPNLTGFRRKISSVFEDEDEKIHREQIKREMRELERQKRASLPLPPSARESRDASSARAQQPKHELIRRTLSEDFPGLDYLGFHDVLKAKHFWYRVLWFSVVSLCLLTGLYTIYRILREYSENPSATLISVKSVEKLLLPQLTICPTNAATINVEKMAAELFLNDTLDTERTRKDVLDFAYFMLAGSGFQKMDWRRFADAQKKARMAELYDQFRGERDVDTFFHAFFDRFGLDCAEFFQHCQLGDETLDCCKVFEPIYLIRRGRCFRTVPLHQRNFDELGKLRVQTQVPRRMDPNMTADDEMIAYIAEHKPQMAPFPRYYLYAGIWTKMRLSAKKITLFPADEVCTETNMGKDACYIERWLQTHLEEPLNCTYPYMHAFRATAYKSCDPLTLVDNYESAVETTNYTMQSCLLGCNRWEYTVQMEKIDTARAYRSVGTLPFTYRVDLSFNDLQYEMIEEVSTVTLAGLVSQIGGQMSLFMGSSILNLIQATIMAVLLCHRTFGRRKVQDSRRMKTENTEMANGRYAGAEEHLDFDEKIGERSSGIPIARMGFSRHQRLVIK